MLNKGAAAVGPGGFWFTEAARGRLKACSGDINLLNGGADSLLVCSLIKNIR